MKGKEDRTIITPELISKYVSGKTTLDEWITVVAAIQKYPLVRKMIETSIQTNREYGINQPVKNTNAQPVCKLYALHLKQLPVMRLAAENEANDCVAKCEYHVLNIFDKHARYKSLLKVAQKKEWLQKGGTPLFNIGRLLELASLSVIRQFKGTLETIQNELKSGCSVIVALNSFKLSKPTARYASECNHAVVVIDVDFEEGYVELYDPQSPNPTDRYSIDAFLKSWKTSKNYYVSIAERGARPYIPHPEFVAHIKLPEEITSIADVLAENAHEIWAKDRLAEAGKKRATGKGVNRNKDPFMRPFNELSKLKQKTDYLSSLNTIKLLYKLGFKLIKNEKVHFKYKSNTRTSDGLYIPNPICVEDVELPNEIAVLTEYNAENTHEEWAKQRLKEGWTFATKTNKKLKQSFDLVPYCELIDSEKEYDRKMALNTLKLLYKMGYSINRF